MSAQVIIINGHDYSRYVERKGLSWSRDDLDADEAGRTMDGVMHRSKITDKRNHTIKLVCAPESVLAQLDTDVSTETYTATYKDLHGTMTKEFYTNSFKATLNVVDDEGEGDWGEATFNMHEV